jgi:hypothetical protein
MILVDAGPLVALIHADDNHHRRCAETFQALGEPLVSVGVPGGVPVRRRCAAVGQAGGHRLVPGGQLSSAVAIPGVRVRERSSDRDAAG